MSQLSTSISKIFGIIFVRSQDGTRLYSKYYPQLFPKNLLRVPEGVLTNIDVQKQFEHNVWEKGKRVGARLTKGSETEIFQYCQFNIVMKAFNEVHLFVLGDFEENEIILSQVINGIYESLNHITKDHINKKTLLENFDQVIIIIDEICDQGIIITIDPSVIIARATMRDTEAISLEKQETSGSSGGGGAFSSVFASAKRTFAQQFMGSG
ncbi:unnamed protein product [Paramecium primaurelia]|uniref:Coatomer subunit zeta n=1 Tax=Paramecium primaurelia TaxID=5886 RepID=A0A8S1LFL2_PARPR|nr:unnamed protein product [Paramecium primaurelia]